jgi:hypothetical protein
MCHQGRRSGRNASFDEHAEQRPCTVQLSLGDRGSALGEVQVFVKGRAVGVGGGLRITGAGCKWELGDGVATLVHKRCSRCVGGNGIIRRGVSRLEGSCESHVIANAVGSRGPITRPGYFRKRPKIPKRAIFGVYLEGPGRKLREMQYSSVFGTVYI